MISFTMQTIQQHNKSGAQTAREEVEAERSVEDLYIFFRFQQSPKKRCPFHIGNFRKRKSKGSQEHLENKNLALNVNCAR